MANEPERQIDGYGPDEMAIPSWVLLQKTGGEWAKGLGGQEGQFHNTGSDEIAGEINIIVVDILTGRARWSEELTDQGPLCASIDARGAESINGDDCSKCAYRLDTPWAIEATARRKMCCINYTILGITVKDVMPCIIRAHGISALPVRQLISQLRLNRALKGEYFRAIINIKSQAKTGRMGTAYAIHPKLLELITDEKHALEFKQESHRLLGAPIPLPEARPEEEVQPIGYTPAGVPFYSEAERDRLMGTVAAAPPGEEIQVIAPQDVGKVEDILTPAPAPPPAAGKGTCKDHGEFNLQEGCPQCLNAKQAAAAAPPGPPAKEEEKPPVEPLDLDF